MVISKREIMSGPTGKESEAKPMTNKKRASQALYVPISQRKKLERYVCIERKSFSKRGFNLDG